MRAANSELPECSSTCISFSFASISRRDRCCSGVTPEQQRSRLDMLAKLNEMHVEEHSGSSELAARISSYELAFRMEDCAPAVVDINNESEATKKLYGLDAEVTEP